MLMNLFLLTLRGSLFHKMSQFAAKNDVFSFDRPLYLASEISAITAANVVAEYLTTECFNDSEKGIQCDLITEDEFSKYDPSKLTYKERIRLHLKEFCDRTSSHGIPMLEEVKNNYYRFVLIKG